MFGFRPFRKESLSKHLPLLSRELYALVMAHAGHGAQRDGIFWSAFLTAGVMHKYRRKLNGSDATDLSFASMEAVAHAAGTESWDDSLQEDFLQGLRIAQACLQGEWSVQPAVGFWQAIAKLHEYKVSGSLVTGIIVPFVHAAESQIATAVER